MKISAIQRRREELDEEMCDLLNHKLTEHDRSIQSEDYGIRQVRSTRSSLSMSD
jgi:hypothetical protein